MHGKVGGKIESARGWRLESAQNLAGAKMGITLRRGGSPMVAGYDKNGNRLTGLKNIGGGNGKA